MFGKEAVKLVTELDMHEDIRPFNEQVMRQVFEEMQMLYEANLEDRLSANVSATPYRTKETMCCYHQCIFAIRLCSETKDACSRICTTESDDYDRCAGNWAAFYRQK